MNTKITNDNATLETLREDGRKKYDLLQSNLTSVTAATDEELAEHLASRNEMASMFGGECGKLIDFEGLREESRKMQDDLDRKGREAFAQEYADTQIKNLE